MSALDFLSVGPSLTALSPLHAATEADGATHEARDGWLVATAFPAEDREAAVRWSDQSHLSKTYVRDGGHRIREDLGLAIGEPAEGLDVTSQFGAIRLEGPAARETIARFCALDLRPVKAPAGSFLPGSIARTPGYVLVEADSFLLIFGAAYGEYMWTVVSDAGKRLGGGPAGA